MQLTGRNRRGRGFGFGRRQTWDDEFTGIHKTSQHLHRPWPGAAVLSAVCHIFVLHTRSQALKLKTGKRNQVRTPLKKKVADRAQADGEIGGCYTGSGGHKYCGEYHIRRALCLCPTCRASKRGGTGLCRHGNQKHKCKTCGGKSLCEHKIQKDRCVQCFKLGRRPKGLCEHGREKWRGCYECNAG